MNDIRGTFLTRIYSAGHESLPGVDMPGVAGPSWYYEDILLALNDKRIARFNPGSFEIIDSLPSRAEPRDVFDSDRNQCVGKEIADVLDDLNGGYFIEFTDGRYFEHSCQPGGSHLSIGRFTDWDCPEEYDEMVSLIRKE